MADYSIPSIDAGALFDPDHKDHQSSISSVRSAATDIGFMTVHNTSISRATVENLLAKFQQFFLLPNEIKAAVDMAKTNSNRGWGASGAEQVSADALTTRQTSGQSDLRSSASM